jgi:hypothetical protein
MDQLVLLQGAFLTKSFAANITHMILLPFMLHQLVLFQVPSKRERFVANITHMILFSLTMSRRSMLIQIPR